MLHNFFADTKLHLTMLILKSLPQQQISSETNQLLQQKAKSSKLLPNTQSTEMSLLANGIPVLGLSDSAGKEITLNFA